MTLEEDNEACLAECARHHYIPTKFLARLKVQTLRQAIKELVQSGDIQSGFRRCKRMGILHCTLEAMILRHRDEFDEDTIQCAEWRLEQAEKTPPRKARVAKAVPVRLATLIG